MLGNSALSAEDDERREEEEEEEEEEKEEGVYPEEERYRQQPHALQYSDSEAAEPSEDGEDDEGWGSSKRDYYNADTIETEADALEEEAEAIRLQKKHLEGLSEADFGFDEAEWLDSGQVVVQAGEEGESGIISEKLPQLEMTDAMGPEERKRILTAKYPEFEPLAREYLELQGTYRDLELHVSTSESMRLARSTAGGILSSFQEQIGSTPIVIIKFHALNAYLGAISMYLAILTSLAGATDSVAMAKSTTDLRDHPVMETLVKCRELWAKVKDVPIPRIFESASVSLTNNKNDDIPGLDQVIEAQGVGKYSEDVQKAAGKLKKRRKSKAEHTAEAALAESNARRGERIRKAEEELASLSTLMPSFERTMKPARDLQESMETNNDNDSDFGEENILNTQEATEKAKRKKSLRFYTSQITQKANMRDTAGRDAGGDTDLPYREHVKDRQARLTIEAENRGKKWKDSKDDELGGESDDEDQEVAKKNRDENSGSENEYYDLVVAHAQKKKADKQSLAAAHEKAALEGGTVVEQEQIGPDGKRAITYAIEKNKGLTPKRKKDVRNPRVKKRKKFEEKKKKLGSIRPIYKGGEGRGGYGGELTGIKTNLVRSMKF